MKNSKKHHAPTDGQPWGDLQRRKSLSLPANQRQGTSAQRRTLFRHLLRNPKLARVATSSNEAVQTATADTTWAKDLNTPIGSTSSSANPTRQSSRVRARSADAPLQHDEIEEAPKRDGQPILIERHRNEEALNPQSQPRNYSSMLLRWTDRLDYLTNSVIGVLATALVISSSVHAGQTDSYRDELPLVANGKTGGGQQAGHLDSKVSLPSDQALQYRLEAVECAPSYICGGHVQSSALGRTAAGSTRYDRSPLHEFPEGTIGVSARRSPTVAGSTRYDRSLIHRVALSSTGVSAQHCQVGHYHFESSFG